MAGNAIGLVLDQCFVYAFKHLLKFFVCGNGDDEPEKEVTVEKSASPVAADKKASKGTDKAEQKNVPKPAQTLQEKVADGQKKLFKIYSHPVLILVRVVVGVYLVNTYGIKQSKDFFCILPSNGRGNVWTFHHV